MSTMTTVMNHSGILDVPLNVAIYGLDGRIGSSANIVLNPTTKVITHLVVKSDTRPHTRYLVPIWLVGETTPASINLHCTGSQLQNEQPFDETDFISVESHHYADAFGSLVAIPETKRVLIHRQHIPLNETAVQRGTQVNAQDGHIGQIDEFLMNPDGHITHLVLRKGHLWGKQDVAIPVSEIAHLDGEWVTLKLTKKQVKELPVMTIRH